MGIIVLHVLMYWGVKSGFVGKAIDTLAPPIEATIVKEQVEDDAPPPPPPPEMERPPVEIPPPVIDINVPIETTTSTALTNTTTERPPAPPPPAPVVVVKVPLKLNTKVAQPNLDDYYPPTSIRLGEEGVVKLKLCVSSAGRVETSAVEESSGVPRLDEAGIKISRVMRFQSPLENGKPVPGCGTLPLRFKMKN